MTVLEIRAGHKALKQLQKHGLQPDAIRVIAGAAGGPKFLGLSRLDQAILETWLPIWQASQQVVQTIGSSIGAVRHAMWAQPDAIAAVKRLEQTYLTYEWDRSHRPEKVSADFRALIQAGWQAHGPAAALESPTFHQHVLTVRGRGPLQWEGSLAFMVSLAAVALMNVAARQSLGVAFDRVVVSDPRARLPLKDQAAFTTWAAPLTAENHLDVLMASSSVPFVMAPVAGIPGMRPGNYRDGGIIDYHLDMPYAVGAEDLVLMPHFTTRVVPGWLDKRLPWRTPTPDHMAHVVLLAPSDAFAASLPNGRIPERKDFTRTDNATRRAAWAATVAEMDRLADDFRHVVAKDLWAERVRPL